MNLAKMATYVYNKKLFDAINLAFKRQNESVAIIKSIQEKKFGTLINHAKNNVPYYKKKLENITGLDDLSKIEFLTKDKIRNYNAEIKAKNINSNRFYTNATSGSTGESLYFYTDAEDFYRKAVIIRGDDWAGLKYGEKALYLWGAERDIDKNKSFYKKLKDNFIVKNKTLSTYHMADKDLYEYMEIYNKYKPSIIVSYPTPLFRFAQFIEQYNINIWKPKGIITSAETLFPFQREKIEKVFDTKVFNRYGCREVGHIASECEIHKGLHINSDRFILEIINQNGEKCEPGELGEIVITDLNNFVFPFIRYKIGDLGVLSDRICKCGRNLPLLEKVEGRIFDLIVGTNGNAVGGTFWTLLKYDLKGWGKFQIVQEKLNYIEIFLENNDEIESSLKQKLTRIVKEKLGDEMIIKINIVDNIPQTQTGKHRWIISKISPYVK